ncbi:MAG: hypothetical protein J0I42_18070 [Bosea sp.]|uniref:hypothetical protein n=1 Tax=Bosea sp. (in: a-proteobacteria) TaxID=1871050 RepID=UPI001AC58D47|nr:hypothetical protein [Bosea sp. (in: a-proteobacteria)]MBN9453849.1 hypothetical protein [Bosea sp. (in: a-proteobacteria)]
MWAEPLWKLCERFGISDVALKKACKKFDVPTPPQGHWNKLQAGKRTVKIALPQRGLGKPEVLVIGDSQWRLWNDAPDDFVPELPDFDEDETAVRNRAHALVGTVNIPDRITRAHVQIATLISEEQKLVEQERASGFSWPRPRFQSPLDRRRLRIANGLLLAGERAGAKWRRGDKDKLEFEATVGETRIGLSVRKVAKHSYKTISGRREREEREEVEVVLGPFRDERESGGRVWSDTESGKLEASAAEILTELFVDAELSYRQGFADLRDWRIQRRDLAIERDRQERERIERETKEQQAALEQARVKRLLDDADNLRKASAIRSYVDQAVREWEKRPGNIAREKLDKWRRWAISQADRIDPVANGSFVMFDEDGPK